jgi:hypothetical protein
MIEMDMDLSGLLPAKKVSAEIQAAALKGLDLGGEHVLKLARDRVPLEEGTLERSGRSSSDGQGTVAVSFDTLYAVKQHEDMTLHHDNGRQAKYLETALADGRKTVAQLVRAAVRRITG